MADPPNASVRVSILAVLSPRLAASPEGLYRAYWPVEARLADLPTCLIGMKACIDAPLQKIMDDISAKSVTFVAGVIAAIQEADDDAAVLTDPNDAASFRDPIAHACDPAQIKFLQSLPQIQAIKARAPYNVIVMFQRKRDLVAQIKAGLPGYLKIGCAALLKDEETILVQTLGMIGVSVGAGVLTGVFPAAAPIALPALTL